MGWDGILISEPHKTVSEKLSVYFKYHEFCENEVVKATIKNGVVYGAIRNLKTNDVWAMVSLLKFRKDGWQTEMLAKNMSEDMMPYYFDCPKSILDLLTKTDNEHSNEWRKRCYEQLAKEKKKAKVKKTDYLFIKSGVKFSDGTIHHVFSKDPCKHFRNLYYVADNNCSQYRLNPNNYDVQYISEEQYLRCKDAYYKIRDAKILVEYEKTNDPEMIKLSQLELCDVYQNVINQTE